MTGAVRLRDGTIGYRMTAGDDCLIAAAATVLQVPPAELPSLNLDARVRRGERPDAIANWGWQTFTAALAERGLRVVTHRKVPVSGKRWIGVVEPEQAVIALCRAQGAPAPSRAAIAAELAALPDGGAFCGHCLVMVGSRLLHDPAPTGLAAAAWRPSDVSLGYSFTTKRR